MQIQLYEAFEKENIAYHGDFMKQLSSIVKEDSDQATLLYGTIFDKLHISLTSIKLETFRRAEA